MSEKLALITVVYENYFILDDFLKSLEKQKNRNFHLYISDLSKNKQKIVSRKIPMTVIATENKGYAHGVNVGITRALQEGENYFCILNNDIFFESDFVSSVIKSLNSHPTSIIGGKIYYAPGYEYHKGRYQKKDLGKVIWYAGGSIDWSHALTPHRGVDEVDTEQYNRFEETDFINGALMNFDAAVYRKVGPLDESYFLYFEDSDYCMRAQKKEVKLYYDPAIVIWHKVSQSTDGSGSDFQRTYQEKNRLKFGLRYAPLKTKLHLIKNYFFH